MTSPVRHVNVTACSVNTEEGGVIFTLADGGSKLAFVINVPILQTSLQERIKSPKTKFWRSSSWPVAMVTEGKHDQAQDPTAGLLGWRRWSKGRRGRVQPVSASRAMLSCGRWGEGGESVGEGVGRLTFT